jgi:hypothetical protein
MAVTRLCDKTPVRKSYEISAYSQEKYFLSVVGIQMTHNLNLRKWLILRSAPGVIRTHNLLIRNHKLQPQNRFSVQRYVLLMNKTILERAITRRLLFFYRVALACQAGRFSSGGALFAMTEIYAQVVAHGANSAAS